MKRLGVLLVAATLLCVLALPAYSTSMTVARCVGVARAILDRADPLDRNPPARVAAAVVRMIGGDRLSATVSKALLDGYSCRGAYDGADWMFEKPALAWQLERSFGQQGLVALYASTTNAAKEVGLSHAAQRLYHRPISQLDDDGVDCIMRFATGAPTDSWGLTPFPNGHAGCPHESLPPAPLYDNSKPIRYRAPYTAPSVAN